MRNLMASTGTAVRISTTVPLDWSGPVYEYQHDTWGPEAANALVSSYGGWRHPWVAS